MVLEHNGAVGEKILALEQTIRWVVMALAQLAAIRFLISSRGKTIWATPLTGLFLFICVIGTTLANEAYFRPLIQVMKALTG
jgi:hypothetical protein